MEEVQRQHINKNLTYLIKNLHVTQEFLAYFESKEILSSGDLSQLNSLLDEQVKAKRLIDILKTRENAYIILITALKETCQTPIATLLDEVFASTSKSTSNSNGNPRTKENHKPLRPPPPQPDPNNNSSGTRNRNIPRFAISSQTSFIHYVMLQPVKDSVRILSTLDTSISSDKLSDCNEPFFPINWAYYPPKVSQKFTLIPDSKHINIITLTNSSLLTLLRVISCHDNKERLKVIILSNQTLENIESILKIFKDSVTSTPFEISGLFDEIKWVDLTPQYQQQLLNKAVKFQGKFVKLGDLRLNDDIQPFHHLNSEILVNLLNEGHEPPTIVKRTAEDPPDFYISRQIHSRSFVPIDLLKEAGPESQKVFLVSEMPKGRRGLENATNDSKKVDHSSNQIRLPWVTKYLIYLDNPEHFEQLCQKRGKLSLYRLQAHSRDETGNIYLEFKEAYPKTADLSLFQENAKKDYVVSELNFLETILSGNDPVCIADVPGMGKSAQLFYFAKEISDRFPKRFVHYSTMSQFMGEMDRLMTPAEKIAPENLERETIINVIRSLSASTKFEEELIKSYLNGSSSSSQINCELMLDGLDEIVIGDQRNLAFIIIEKIKSFLKTTRLWLTLRKHMLMEMENKLHVLGCNLSPFSLKDQISYLAQRWTKKEIKNRRKSNAPKELPSEFQTKLRQFAQVCVEKVNKSLEEKAESSGESGLELTGNPLQCRLIGDKYFHEASKYANSNTEDGHGIIDSFIRTSSITGLYYDIVEKKLNNHLKRKGIPEDKINNFFIHHLARSDFLKRHMLRAVKNLFPQNLEILSILSSDEKDEEKMDLEVTNYGLLSRSSNRVEFVHRTYAEYFVARLVVEFEGIEGIAQASKQEMRRRMAEFVVGTVLSHSKHFGFIPSLWFGKELHPPFFNYPTVVYFLNEMMNVDMLSGEFKEELRHAWNRESKTSGYREWILMRPPVFMAAILCNHQNIAQLQLVSLNQREKFRKNTKGSHRDMVIIAAEYGDYSLVKYISEQIIGRKVSSSTGEDRKVADIFTKTKTRKLPFSGGLAPLKPNCNPLYAALKKGDIDTAIYLMDSQGFTQQTWKLFKDRHPKKLGVLHILVQNSWGDSDDKIHRRIRLIETILRKCERDTIINQVDEDERTPILQPKVDIRIIQHLVRRNANVLLSDTNGNTLLHLLCQQEGFGHYRKYEQLFSNVINGQRSPREENPLLRAETFINNHERLLSHPKDSELGSDPEYLALSQIVENMKTGERENLQSAHNIASTLGFMGSMIQKMKIDRETQAKKWDIGNTRGDTPLHNAVLAGNLDAIKLMVGYSIFRELNVENKEGLTPLCMVTTVASGLQMEIAHYLIYAGADVRARTVLHGLQNGLPENGVIQWLQDLRFSGRIKTEDDRKEMLVALFRNKRLDLQSFQTLLEWIMEEARNLPTFVYLDKEHEDRENRTTLLHIAVENLTLAHILWLTKTFRINMNVPDWQGNTALHKAYIGKNEKIAEFLVGKGADDAIKNGDGVTPENIRRREEMKVKRF